MNLNNLSLEELASYVCTELEKRDIKVVLSGGSCMELYTNAMYSSYDIDFVMQYSYSSSQIEKTMLELGFTIDGKYYVLDESKFFVEILTPPVAVGDEFVQKFASRDTKLGTLKLLTPTDCIKDRLCGCYLHGDKQCFEHALAVASKNEVDIADLKKWSKSEDKLLQQGIKNFLFSIEVMNNPSDENISKYLNQFCKQNYIDVHDELGQQDLIDDLSQTFLWNKMFSSYSQDKLVDYVKKSDEI
jgi:hypothetical protein